MKVAEVGSIGLGAARGFEREALDFYPTDPRLTRALLSVETFDGGVWEPACGDGAMSKLFKAQGIPTTSTELAKRGYGRGGVDFLKTRRLRRPNIVTNPPFNLWLPFARHALDLKANKVVLLGRLLMLEGWERAEFFRRTELSRVWVVGRARMLPPGAEDKGFSPMICFAWFVWDWTAKGLYYGRPQVDWVRPDKAVRA